jgi:predicted DNA-binding transcriptional regulator YafY
MALLTEESGGTRLECSSSNLEYLAMTLLPLSPDLEIRRPDELRVAFQSVASRAIAIASKQFVGTSAAD